MEEQQVKDALTNPDFVHTQVRKRLEMKPVWRSAVDDHCIVETGSNLDDMAQSHSILRATKLSVMRHVLKVILETPVDLSKLKKPEKPSRGSLNAIAPHIAVVTPKPEPEKLVESVESVPEMAQVTSPSLSHSDKLAAILREMVGGIQMSRDSVIQIVNEVLETRLKENTFQFPAMPQEFKVVSLRECATIEEKERNCSPASIVAYWQKYIATDPRYDREREHLVVYILDSKHRIRGHQLVSLGSLDSTICHAREVFKLAIASSSHSIVIAHNHPSGDALPSSADLMVTADMKRAGEILKIPLVDHIIIGDCAFHSFKESGEAGYTRA